MGLKYENLDEETRGYMVEEILADTASDRIYRSPYLTQQAQGQWPDMLIEAAGSGNDDSLAAAIRTNGCLNATTTRNLKGKTIRAAVPHTAPETLAEGEFNRYYARGLSLKALANGIERLEVYRAKSVANPRPESEQKIGLLVDPQVLLADLRASIGFETALGIPPGPNSGISVRIPK